MATTPKRKSTAAKGKTAGGTAAAKNPFAELNKLVANTVEMERVNREQDTGKQYSYLKLVGNSANDPVTKKGRPEYIEGAGNGVWVIPSKKLCLGEEVRVTVLGAFKLYEDTVAGEKADPKSKQEPMRQTVGYWMPQEAMQIEDVVGFDRCFTDNRGEEHILRPVHWVFLHLHDYPEIDDALLTFRGKANGIYKDMQKLIASHATSALELRLTLSHQEKEAVGYGRDYFYPYFEVDGLNFKMNPETMEIEGLVRGGFNKTTLEELLVHSNTMQSEYANNKMLTKQQSLASIVAGAGTGTGAGAVAGAGSSRKQIASKPGMMVDDDYVYDDDDDEEELPRF